MSRQMSETFRRVFLPYCLQQQANGGYAVLNRKYKPLGFLTNEWVKYEDYPILVGLDGLTESVARTISRNGSADLQKIYLYDDGSVPKGDSDDMKAYLFKLAVLAHLQVTSRR